MRTTDVLVTLDTVRFRGADGGPEMDKHTILRTVHRECVYSLCHNNMVGLYIYILVYYYAEVRYGSNVSMWI